MSRIPPSLLYLTIYNPSLRPDGPVSDEDEDAEEQAHILFYTSKEHSVSRDRMLRQVGLAKALVNFSEMFNADDSCGSVHSQSRRMIMVSPEPNFWIHAGVEVAKVLRPTLDKGKAKAKEKHKDNDPEVAYDYHDGSVHDIAVRRDILRGYERFKLTHGSFTSILSTLGRQALELQLERFFTVWAWSWNLEDGHDFGEHLGIPLHPLFRSLVPLMDEFSIRLSDGLASIFITPPCIVPSSIYTSSQYPPSLARHLLSLIPPEDPNTRLTDLIPSDSTTKAKSPSDPESLTERESAGGQGPSPSMSLGMPAVTMVNMNMDVRKWNWPGYLTFGRGSGKRPGLDDDRKVQASDDKPKPVDLPPTEHATSSDDNPARTPSILEDSAVPTNTGPSSDYHNTYNRETDEERPVTPDNLPSTHIRSPAGVDLDSASIVPPTPSPADTVSPVTPVLGFSSISVYLAEPGNPLATTRRKIHYIVKHRKILALVGVDGSIDDLSLAPSQSLDSIAESSEKLLDDIENKIASDTSLSTSELPSATRILQPTDSYIASAAQLTVSSPGFVSKSSHLYNAQALQDINPEISEVFSRGQNPQHWHVARRGLGVSDDGKVNDGEVYMEVFRKEASLADVDNVLVGVVRRCDLVDAVG